MGECLCHISPPCWYCTERSVLADRLEKLIVGFTLESAERSELEAIIEGGDIESLQAAISDVEFAIRMVGEEL